MKICYINPTFLVRRPIADLIGLLGEENEIGIFIPKKLFKRVDSSWHSNASLNKAKIYSYSAINIPFINFEWPIPITPMFIINLFKIFFRYKIIHMWTYFYINSMFTLLFRLFSRKTKLIMTCDTFPAYSFKSGFFVDSLFIAYTTVLGQVIFSVPDKVQIYGRSMLSFAKSVGIKEEKITILPTGIDLKKFYKLKNIRKELGYQEEDFILVYAGLIVPRKGIDIMLKTVERIKNQRVKLLLVGEGPKKKEYIKLVKKLKIEKQVNFLGWRKDIPSILNSADVLFLPSRGEGLPGIVMEAMACKKAIIASDIPCLPDLVKEGKCGFLCNLNDINQFTEVINKLVLDNQLSKRYGKHAFKQIKEFNWNNLIKEYKQMYSA